MPDSLTTFVINPREVLLAWLHLERRNR